MLKKNDWKIHRILCPYMKNDEVLLSINEVERILSILDNEAKLRERTIHEIRFLEYCLKLSKYQYGEKIIGLPYHKRGNDVLVLSWNAEIDSWFKYSYTICGIFVFLTRDQNTTDAYIFNLQQALFLYVSQFYCLGGFKQI